MKSAAERVLELREKHPDVTMRAICEAVGCTEVYVSRVLNRGRPPKPRGTMKHLVEHLARTTTLTVHQIARRVDCNADYASNIVHIVRSEGKIGGPDGSVPKFANHDLHVAKVMSEGGFVRPVRLPDGRLVLVRPEAA